MPEFTSMNDAWQLLMTPMIARTCTAQRSGSVNMASRVVYYTKLYEPSVGGGVDWNEAWSEIWTSYSGGNIDHVDREVADAGTRVHVAFAVVYAEMTLLHSPVDVVQIVHGQYQYQYPWYIPTCSHWPIHVVYLSVKSIWYTIEERGMSGSIALIDVIVLNIFHVNLHTRTRAISRIARTYVFWTVAAEQMFICLLLTCCLSLTFPYDRPCRSSRRKCRSLHENTK